MISGSKACHHGKLSCRWGQDFMTRPNMRWKWGWAPRIVNMGPDCGNAQHETIRNITFDPPNHFIVQLFNTAFSMLRQNLFFVNVH